MVREDGGKGTLSLNQPNKRWSELRKILGASLQIARQEGLRSLSRQVWQKIKRRELHIVEPQTQPEIISQREFQITEQEHLTFLLEKGPRNPKVSVPPVAIVIPVYRAADYLKRCLKSVLRNTPSIHEVIIVDDCNTDQRILETLKSIRDRITVLRNNENMGFVRSANRGLIHAEDRHVIILNQDTEVPPGWIERIMSPILEDSIVASVTPFSNGSTTTSFPEFCKDNEPYRGLDTEKIDLFFQKYGGDPVEIPSGIGFCMALNRKTLDDVGLFDEETFGRGYCEENDWCMRAWKKGYKNLAISNLFVYHKHGASFSNEKKKLLEDNLAKLYQMYPEYLPWVQDFIAKDPFSSLRKTIRAIIDFNISKVSRVLCMSHNLGGGSDSTLAMITDSNIAEFLVAKYDYKTCGWILAGRFFKSIVPDKTFNCGLDRLCEIFGISHILINQVVSHPNPTALLDFVEKTQLPYTCIVNDYFCYCPNWNLIGVQGIYCNLPDIATCRHCLRTNNIADFRTFSEYREIDPEAWRTRWKDFLSKAKSTVCLSESSAKLIKQMYPISNISIIEPPVLTQFTEKNVPRKKDHLMVAVIGGIGVHKGSEILKQLFDLTQTDPVRFVIAGTTNWIQGPYLSPDGKVEITGRFENQEALARILSSRNVDLSLFPSIWPETYAYTVTEAMLMGYPVLSFDLGAPAERIKKTDAGTTVIELRADSIKKALIHIQETGELLRKWTKNTSRFSAPTYSEFTALWKTILN